MSPRLTDLSSSQQRSIFLFGDERKMQNCLQIMEQVGVRPLRCLEHLDIIIGEHASLGVSKLHLQAVAVETDLRLTLTEPHGSIKVSTLPSLPWGIRRIEAPRCWSVSRGRGVRIAVIDTGIDSGHEAVAKNYHGGVNILSPASPPTDYNGHGTHVAGIIAGRSMKMGLMGVAPRAALYAVKAFNRRGSAQLSDLLVALNWCIENKMHIVNMSFGMEKKSAALLQAVRKAYERGLLMVAATGNEGIRGRVDYPAGCPETISVMSFSSDGKISSFSNRGRHVDIAAPGEKIPSAWPQTARREMSGTSMAVPHVTGTLALLLRRHGPLSLAQVRNLLYAAAIPLAGDRALHARNVLRIADNLPHSRRQGSA